MRVRGGKKIFSLMQPEIMQEDDSSQVYPFFFLAIEFIIQETFRGRLRNIPAMSSSPGKLIFKTAFFPHIIPAISTSRSVCGVLALETTGVARKSLTLKHHVPLSKSPRRH